MESWDIHELVNNINTGIEYEYALYYCLLAKEEQRMFKSMVIDRHARKAEIEQIISATDISRIIGELTRRNLRIESCSIETQNDAIGPSDIVMNLVEAIVGEKSAIGISVKYQNSCTLNVTGKMFISEENISELKDEQRKYSALYIKEMQENFGEAENWFRKRKNSCVTDGFIDLIRDKVIENWPKLENKEALIRKLFQMDSPINYWVYEYRQDNSHILYVNPPRIDLKRVNEVNVKKHETSYISFLLEDRMVGKMQVKFNNGILENCKKGKPDFTVEGTEMSMGAPFSSWNFSVIY